MRHYRRSNNSPAIPEWRGGVRRTLTQQVRFERRGGGFRSSEKEKIWFPKFGKGVSDGGRGRMAGLGTKKAPQGAELFGEVAVQVLATQEALPAVPYHHHHTTHQEQGNRSGFGDEHCCSYG